MLFREGIEDCFGGVVWGGDYDQITLYEILKTI